MCDCLVAGSGLVSLYVCVRSFRLFDILCEGQILSSSVSHTCIYGHGGDCSQGSLSCDHLGIPTAERDTKQVGLGVSVSPGVS